MNLKSTKAVNGQLRNYHSTVGLAPCECPEAQAANMGHL